MTREILDESHVHPAIRAAIANDNADIIREVQAAIAANDIVVVGMKQNPFPRKARKALNAAGLAHEYLEYGSYFKGWRAAQRIEDVDRVADLPNGVRQGHSGRRRCRSGTAHPQRRVEVGKRPEACFGMNTVGHFNPC